MIRGFSFASLRARLSLVVLLAILPAMGLILYTAWDQRRLASDEVRGNALRLVRLAASNQERSIAAVREVLVALAHIHEVHGGDRAACARLLTRLMKQYPDFLNFGAAKPDGEIFCSGLPTRGPINAAHRAWFRRALQGRDFSIGEYQIGSITHRPTINFSYPMLDGGGHVRAVLFAAVGLSSLNQLAAEIQLPEGGTLTVFDRLGTILARHPNPDRWLGLALPEAPLVKAVLRQKAEGTAEAAGVDGAERLYAFSLVRNAPEAGMYVAIGLSKQVAFAGVDRALRRNLAALGLVTLLALGAAWVVGDLFVGRPVKALVEATRRMSRGDLGARTGLPDGRGELSHLAQAFDEMAASLQARQAEAMRADAALQEAYAKLEQRVEERTLELRTANESLQREIAERKQAEEKVKRLNEEMGRRAVELERLNKELEAFSYSVSHDLRAPLRHIVGFAELLEKHAALALDDKGRRYLRTISDSASQMGRLIDDLLAFSRMGRADMRETTVELVPMVKSVLADMEGELRGRDITWDIGPLPAVRGDPAMLRLALVNLISNAIKYTRPRTRARVEIGSAARDGEIVFFIRDNGVGFDMRYLDKLFGVFQRLHSASDFEGTGIGLASVRRIIHRHGGTVWAEGFVDGGATFYFSLPDKAGDTI
jgi:signal transduction histidine kinase